MSQKRKSQPYQIKGVDALFGEPSASEAAAELVPLSQICLPPQQPRYYFEPQAMQELVNSVKQYGILAPLLVRPKGQNSYELVAGERRYRAAQTAGLEEVPVVVRQLTDVEAFELALLENLQREDLNPVEETEGILQLLANKLNRTPEAVTTLLNQAAHSERESVNNVIHSPEWGLVVEAFSSIGKFTPNSFRTNRLPLLNLPQDVLKTLREGKIAYTKAKVIAGIKDEAQRKALLKVAISEDLSLSHIKERIKDLRAVPTGKNEEPSLSLKSRMNTAYTKAKKSKVWDDPKKQRKLEKLLSELEALLDGN